MQQDGTPNMQKTILGCMLITQLMARLHMHGIIYVSDLKVEKMQLIIGEKIQDVFTTNALIREI